MKKMIIFSVVMLFTTFNGFSSTSESRACFDWAIEQAYAEQDHYGGSSEDLVDAANWYYGACEESGGPGGISTPVFL